MVAVDIKDNKNNAHTRETAIYNDRDLLSEFFAPEKQATLDAVAMQLHISLDEMRQRAQAVVNEWVLTGQTHPTYNDASRHLISILRKTKQWGKSAKNASPSESGLGVGEFRNAKGQRTYAQGGVVVPESAPPRPSAGHYWNKISGMWENFI